MKSVYKLFFSGLALIFTLVGQGVADTPSEVADTDPHAALHLDAERAYATGRDALPVREKYPKST